MITVEKRYVDRKSIKSLIKKRGYYDVGESVDLERMCSELTDAEVTPTKLGSAAANILLHTDFNKKFDESVSINEMISTIATELSNITKSKFVVEL